MDQTYFCGKCGGYVTPNTRRCPHCKIILSGVGKGDEQKRRRLRRAYLERKWGNFIRAAFRRVAIALIIALGTFLAWITFSKVILRWWRISIIIMTVPIILLILFILIAHTPDWWRGRSLRVAHERLFSSLRSGDLERATKLFEQRPEMFFAVDEQRNNPLHIAAKSGRMDIVKFLLGRDGFGTWRVRAMDENSEGLTPLRVAEQSGFPEIADLIRGEEGAHAEWIAEMLRKESARKKEEAKRAEIIAATRERTLKELELQGKRHYAICKNCGTAHEKPMFSPKQAGESWYCKACGKGLGRYDMYDGGTLSTPRWS